MVGIKIEKEFIDLNAMIRDERNIPQNIRNGQVRHMVCHCYKGSSKWIEHYKPDDGHEPHNQALAKELSRLCMPDIPDNLRYAEHLIRWGSVTLALSTVQHRVDSFYDLANLKILASDTAQKAATDAGNANKIAERNRSNEGKSKELYLKLLEYAKLKADFAKDMMAYSVKMNEAKTLDEAEKIKRIEAERSERKILIHPQIKMSQAEFIQFYDYGAK
jgi:hypothetical protein